MDSQTFDRWTVAITAKRNRRSTLGLVIGAAAAGLLAPSLARAQRADRDYDGLFDDDETDVYGTNPDVYDTDGDGSGDGEEIYYGTNPLDASSYAEVVGNGDDLGLSEPAGPANTIDIPPVVCPGPGYPCNYDTECCGVNVRCCWDGVSLRTECTDVSAYGGNCPY